MIQLKPTEIKKMAKHVHPYDLPGELTDAASYIGVHKAMLLAYHMAGRVYLKQWSEEPSKWNKNMKLMVKVIGLEDARIMVQKFNGHFDIPKCDDFWRAWIHKMIVESDGLDQVELGRLYGYSDRHVRRIQKKATVHKDQLGLFDI